VHSWKSSGGLSISISIDKNQIVLPMVKTIFIYNMRPDRPRTCGVWLEHLEKMAFIHESPCRPRGSAKGTAQ